MRKVPAALKEPRREVRFSIEMGPLRSDLLIPQGSELISLDVSPQDGSLETLVQEISW